MYFVRRPSETNDCRRFFPVVIVRFRRPFPAVASGLFPGRFSGRCFPAAISGLFPGRCFPAAVSGHFSGQFPGRCFRSFSGRWFRSVSREDGAGGCCFQSVSRPLFPVGFAFSFLSAVSGCCSHSFFSDSATVSDRCPRSFFSGFSPEAVLKKRRGDGIVRKCPEQGAFEPVRTRNHSPETP